MRGQQLSCFRRSWPQNLWCQTYMKYTTHFMWTATTLRQSKIILPHFVSNINYESSNVVQNIRSTTVIKIQKIWIFQALFPLWRDIHDIHHTTRFTCMPPTFHCNNQTQSSHILSITHIIIVPALCNMRGQQPSCFRRSRPQNLWGQTHMTFATQLVSTPQKSSTIKDNPAICCQ